MQFMCHLHSSILDCVTSLVILHLIYLDALILCLISGVKILDHYYMRTKCIRFADFNHLSPYLSVLQFIFSEDSSTHDVVIECVTRDILQIVHVGVKVEDIGAPQSAREVGRWNVDLGLL